MKINIFPKINKEEIRMGYKKRIIITCLWATFFTSLASIVFIFPSYIIARTKLSEINEKKSINALAAQEQNSILNAPRLVNQKALLAIQSEKAVSIANRIITISNTLNSGISMTKISYQQSATKDKNQKIAKKVIVTGEAIDRDSLMSFEKKVSEIPFVRSTSIPVGDYARGKNLSFNITIDISNE